MRVYFVRHGETLLNRSHTHQSKDTPLSVKGTCQAESIAQVLKSVNPDLLLSSTYQRARQTADIIGTVVGLTPEGDPLFTEVHRPERFAGTSHYSLETLRYAVRSVLNKNDPSWRYEDGENFTDIFTRVKESFDRIATLQSTHKTVIIVSHSIFITMMVAYLCHDRMIAVRDLLPALLHLKRMKNCGVVELQYIGGVTPTPCSWRVVRRF